MLRNITSSRGTQLTASELNSGVPLRWKSNMDQLASRSNGDLVCFSHLPWDFVFQRPQHILSRATASFRVHYFEEPRYEEVIEPRLDVRMAPQRVSVATPILPAGIAKSTAFDLQRRLVNEYVGSRNSVSAVGWYYTPAALNFTRHLDFDVTVYDCMDELSQFKDASPDLIPLEAELLVKADVVFAGGLSLYEAKVNRHGNVHVFPSSVNTEHFSPARLPSIVEPADMVSIPHPRIGYFGVIDERIDYRLIAELSLAKPDWHLVMIGPTAKINTSSLPRSSNIHWLGRKPYFELPAYLSHIDIGFMPFALNASTRFISPTKTPEFLAAGCPVVSTPIRDVVRTWREWGLVEIASNAAAVVEAIERIQARNSAEWLVGVDEKLASGSWARTWSAMLREVENVRRKASRAVLHGETSAISVNHV